MKLEYTGEYSWLLWVLLIMYLATAMDSSYGRMSVEPNLHRYYSGSSRTMRAVYIRLTKQEAKEMKAKQGVLDVVPITKEIYQVYECESPDVLKLMLDGKTIPKDAVEKLRRQEETEGGGH